MINIYIFGIGVGFRRTEYPIVTKVVIRKGIMIMTHGEWKNIFGDNLSTILREKRISQKDLSRDSGVSMGMVSDYVNKLTAPNIFAVINMAYALDVEIDELIDFGDCIEN